MTPSQHFRICRAELLADIESERQDEIAEQRAEILAELQAESEGAA
jgi:hypothetical protein